MKLTTEVLQKLKEKKISSKDLNVYLVEPQHDGVDNNDYEIKVKIENILKLLNENIFSFQQIVDKFKSMKNKYNEPYLWKLIQNKELFQELIQNNRLNTKDLKYLLKKIDNDDELWNLSKNTVLLKYIIDKNIVSFQKLIDKYKNIKARFNDSCLQFLLSNKEIFNELVLSNKLNTEDLRYLLSRLDYKFEFSDLAENAALLKQFIATEILSFRDLLDKCRNFYESVPMIRNIEFFEELIQNNRLTQDDLRYLVSTIRTRPIDELCALADNVSLLKYMISIEIVSFKEIVDKFNSSNDSCLNSLLWHEELFEELTSNNKLTQDDLRYLLNAIDKYSELKYLHKNTSLLRYILDNELFQELVDKYKDVN